MDEVWERAVETALDGEKDHATARTLTLDGAVKCIQGRLPSPSLLEKFQNLQHLSIASIGVSSLEQFPKLLKLERLILSDNRISCGLEFLVEAGLDSLRDLDLSNNRIQYIEDLAPLAQLKLVSLDLYECPVTRVKDYRSRVFKLIKSLKYLDKMDLQEKERPESEDEDEDDNEEEDEEEDDDPGSGEIDGEDRQFVEANGHGEGVGGVVNVDEEEESEAEEEEMAALPRLNGPNRIPNDFDINEEDFDINDIGDHFAEVHQVHQVVGSDDDEVEGIEYDEDDDEDEVDNDYDDDDDDDDDDEESDDDEEEQEDDDDDEMGIGSIAQVELAFDEPLPDSRGLFMDMRGEIDGHEQGEEDGDGDNNGETGEEEIGIDYDPEFEDEDDDDDDEEEDLGTGYLVQPISRSQALNTGINGENNDEKEEETDDNDSNEAQVLPPSSSNLKRKRDDDGDEH